MSDHSVNWKLKERICERFGTQKNFSIRSGIKSPSVSGMVNGWYRASPSERTTLANLLGTDVLDIIDNN